MATTRTNIATSKELLNYLNLCLQYATHEHPLNKAMRSSYETAAEREARAALVTTDEEAYHVLNWYTDTAIRKAEKPPTSTLSTQPRTALQALCGMIIDLCDEMKQPRKKSDIFDENWNELYHRADTLKTRAWQVMDGLDC